MKTTANLNALKDMTNAQLNANLVEKKSELFNLRFQLAVNQLDIPTRIKAVKKTCLKILISLSYIIFITICLKFIIINKIKAMLFKRKFM